MKVFWSHTDGKRTTLFSFQSSVSASVRSFWKLCLSQADVERFLFNHSIRDFVGLLYFLDLPDTSMRAALKLGINQRRDGCPADMSQKNKGTFSSAGKPLTVLKKPSVWWNLVAQLLRWKHLALYSPSWACAKGALPAELGGHCCSDLFWYYRLYTMSLC